MDEVASYNRARWDDLADAGAIFTRPWRDLSNERARALVDPYGLIGAVDAINVLCVASGGGQQAVAFAVLGARVTSIDISPAQVRRDVDTAAHYSVEVTAVEGDMRDLNKFAADSFDVVHHAYSINFVPDPRVVFEQVARVLRRGGLYQLFVANPFGLGLARADWHDDGYLLRRPYVQGSVVRTNNPAWFFRDEPPQAEVPPAIEYCHTLGTLVSGLAQHDLAPIHLVEVGFGDPDPSAPPGTREHLSAVMPRWLDLAARYLPGVLRGASESVPGEL